MKFIQNKKECIKNYIIKINWILITNNILKIMNQKIWIYGKKKIN